MRSHRFEVKPDVLSQVRVLHHTREVPANTPGWYADEMEARRRTAALMNQLAADLMRQADFLTRDRRGD